jgi:hypothetical protein
MTETGRAAGERAAQQRPSYLTDTLLSPAGEFLIHYAITGSHAVDTTGVAASGVPDFIALAAAALDSLKVGYSALGWREPLDDSDGVFDVYFIDMATAYGIPIFGLTWWDQPSSSTPPYTSPAFMELENDFLPVALFNDHPPVESLRVTIAHEYHHAVQFAYNLAYETSDYDRYLWFAELSATYFEEIFYNGINDYYFYLPYFLGAPHLSLADINGLHMYGAVLWALYLDAVEGADFNRLLWTRMADDASDALDAHIGVLADRGTDMLQRYREFSVWQLSTGTRAVPGSYFQESAAYPGVTILPGDLQPSDVTIPSLALRCYRAQPTTTDGGLAIRTGPVAAGIWGGGVAGELTSGQLQGLRTSVATGSGAEGLVVELLDWADYGDIVHWTFSGIHSISDPLGNQQVGLDFVQSDRLTAAALQGGGFRLLQNYPNPFRPDETANTFFAFNLPGIADVTIEIRSMGGATLWTQRFQAFGAGLHYTGDTAIGWDGRDLSGSLVPAGVYLIVARSEIALGGMQAQALEAQEQGGVRQSATIVEVKPDEPMTLVFPTFLHTWGFQRIGQAGAVLYSRGRTRFDDPQGVAVTVLDAWDDPSDSKDDDEITVYGVNSGRGEIIYNTSMHAIAIYGDRGGGEGEFLDPHGIDADPSGNLVVADSGNDRVAVLFNDGRLLSHRRYLQAVASGDTLSAPYDVALVPGEGVWISDSGNARLVLFGLDGEVRRLIDLSAIMAHPGALSISHRLQRWSYFREHGLFIADQDGGGLVKVDQEGHELARIEAGDLGQEKMEIRYLTSDFYANIWATDAATHQIHKFDRQLNHLDSFGSRGRKDGQFESPRGIGMWKRFGQMIVAEEKGAQYFWVGADARELAARQAGPSVELSYFLTEFAYVTVRARFAGGGFVELYRRRFRRVGAQEETLTLPEERPLAWLEVVLEPTYSSYKYREKVYQFRFPELERR